MIHVCKLDCTTAPQAASFNSNIDAKNSPPRDNPEMTPKPVDPRAWPRPEHLAVGRGHRMAYRLVGNPLGEPWLLVHGGPGSSCHPGMLAPLDLARQWAIAPDQRGCGASRPPGRTQGNHTHALVADLEALRRHLGIERWSLLAGSWGTVVALAYAQAHPQRVLRLVLRGAFALSRREIGGLLRPSPRLLRRLGPERFWPTAPGAALPSVLTRLTQVLQSGTPGVASLRVTRRWALLESVAAGDGLRRSLRHAAGPQQARLAAAIRRDWAGLRRGQRRALARAHHPRADRADHRAWQKFRVQGHYLRHRGFMRPAALGQAVHGLGERGVPMDWVHGRFDAVCPPANSRRWAALAGQLHQPLSGHLGHEPDMLATLRARVRSGLP